MENENKYVYIAISNFLQRKLSEGLIIVNTNSAGVFPEFVLWDFEDKRAQVEVKRITRTRKGVKITGRLITLRETGKPSHDLYFFQILTRNNGVNNFNCFDNPADALAFAELNEGFISL